MDYYCRNCYTQFTRTIATNCPHCHSDDIVNARYYCAECGEPLFQGDEVVQIKTEVFCTECADIKTL